MLQNKPISISDKHICHQPGHHMPPKPHPDHCHPFHCHDNILINPYNKVCFKDKSEAEQMLLNKDLHAGETAYAYYFDGSVAYGINAISAVGNIKVGAPNILFENSEDITKHIEAIHKVLEDHTAIMLDIKETAEELENKTEIIDTVTDKLDSFVEDTNESITAVQDDINVVRDFANTIEEHLSYTDSSIYDLKNKDALLDSRISELAESIKSIDGSISDITGDNEDSHNSLDEFKKEFDDYKIQHAFDVEQDKLALINDYTEKIHNVDTSLREFINTENAIIQNDLGALTVQLALLSNTVETSKAVITAEVDEKIEKVLSDGKWYVDTECNNLKSAAIAEFDNVKASIKNVSTQFEDLSTMLVNKITDISVKLDEAIQNHVNDVQNLYNSLEQECIKYKTYIDTTLSSANDNIKLLIESLNSTIDNKYKTLKTEFDTSLSTAKSALDARITTVKTTLRSESDNKYVELSDLITKKTREVSREIDTKIAEERTFLDTRYELKDHVRPMHVAEDGGILNINNHISLNIDAYGVLTFNGIKYQLQAVRS